MAKSQTVKTGSSGESEAPDLEVFLSQPESYQGLSNEDRARIAMLIQYQQLKQLTRIANVFERLERDGFSAYTREG